MRYVFIFVLLGVLSCGEERDNLSSGTPIENEDAFVLPPGFPAPPIPENSPYSKERAELGRHLFYDVRLSGNGEQSCSSCHQQKFAFADGLATPEGSTKQPLSRNSQQLTNVAYNSTLTWANPLLKTLEAQLLIPIFGESPVELGVTGNEKKVMDRFRSDEKYQALYAAAFDAEDPFTWENTVKAISTFVRSLISGNSPFDKLTYQNDDSQMSASALRGMELFYSERLECHHCHGGFNFTGSTIHEGSAFDNVAFHNTGLYNINGDGSFPINNQGVFEVSANPDDRGRFRAPTLRNVEVTGPFMHDGSIKTLEEVIRFYEAGGRFIKEGEFAGDGRKSPLKSGFVSGFTLTDGERGDLIEFLKSLTDKEFLTNPAHSNPNPEEEK